VVSSNGKNYRLNPIDGVKTDDADLNPAGGVISSAAYTNSGPGTAPATTTLYNYNVATNQLVRQDAPNTGTFTSVGSSGITVNAGARVNFDIFFDPAAPAATQNKAFLVASTGSFAMSDMLYTVNLTTGAATAVEFIGAGMPISGVSALISGTVLSSNKASAKVSAQVDVYPNPATGEVSINMPAALLKQSVQATLVNTLGQPVMRRTLSARDGATQRLSLTNVPKGIYTLQLSTPEGLVTKRLMVR
jgi:hypothetical protein